ncbi:MAG: multidrug efflux SMR transporter [Kocuria sp.]|mgnify:CR=1 FL=1|jgi:quaternary ammonium compound-resistance protein SugE|nr:multidrug efflux SMR transporter [Kocuria sp.]MDN5654714.1 multidrug efflux SMR transporter [Kocuria sp.]
MAWIILLASAVLEAVWATALGRSNGFSELGPTLVFIVAIIGSMAGLGVALKSIPIGTAYAIWTGIGAALTVIYGMATGDESVSALKVLCIVGIVGATVGLKLVPSGEPKGSERSGSSTTSGTPTTSGPSRPR